MTQQFTEEELAEYKEAFDLFDKDRDGAITTQELNDVMTALGQSPTEEDLKKMLQEVDTDGNGIIDLNEFLNLITRHQETSDPEKDMLDVFRMFDKNGDGFITADELSLVMTNLGQSMSDDEVREMIGEADNDGDGRIDYEEFVKMMMTK